MNDLLRYFLGNTGRASKKWMHYFEIYDRHLASFRGKDVTVVEIGIDHGGSLQMWKSYFGPSARIVGVDIEESCKAFEEERIRILIGDQGDRAFLRRLREEVGPIDILIDDGGHTMEQQKATFEEIFPAVTENGIYICEDVHTSYWREFAGGYRKRTTFIEYAKDLVDQLNAWFSRDTESFQADDFTHSAHSLHFYPSVVVVEKRNMTTPQHRISGSMVEGIRPSTISDSLGLAYQHQISGRFAEAERLYRSVLSLDPRQSDALHMLALLASRRGELAEARDLFISAAEQTPETPGLWFNIGRMITRILAKGLEGDKDAPLTAEAVAEMELVLSFLPYEEHLTEDERNLLGFALHRILSTAVGWHRAGLFAESARLYRLVLKYRPGLGDALHLLGMAEYRLGNREEALAFLDRAIAVAPEIPGLIANRERVLREG